VEPAPEPPKPAPPRPVLAPPERLIAAPESAAPAAVVTPPPAPLAAVESPAAPPEPAAPPAPASPVAPRTLPPEAVQYLVPPAPVYPKLSRRDRESGRVLMRVYIDEGGVPRAVKVAESSGYPRLDAAACAAAQATRFKPYAENGRPTAGWAFIPVTFALE
ncbi:MAG: energy transducer TonB, partial [Burkholderiaceae bacterium]|nr:energy transducer TonB [Burkholderiaceae bacterium]